jgi:ABC-type cobalamin/Fe3+-siderophores transport system ATPase subunit
MEFTFTSKGEYSSTLLNLLTSILNFKEGDMTCESDDTRELQQYNS